MGQSWGFKVSRLVAHSLLWECWILIGVSHSRAVGHPKKLPARGFSIRHDVRAAGQSYSCGLRYSDRMASGAASDTGLPLPDPTARHKRNVVRVSGLRAGLPHLAARLLSNDLTLWTVDGT